MKGSSNNPMADLVGPDRRRPLRGHTSQFLSRIYSLFPDQNPFPNLALPAALTPDELGRKNQTESAIKVACDTSEAVDINAMVCNIREYLSHLEGICMDESHDVGRFKMPHKKDFRVNTNIVENSMPVESNASGQLLTEGNIKDDVAGKNNKMEVDVNTLSFGGGGGSDARVSMERGVTNVSDAVDQFGGDMHPVNVERNERNFSNEEIRKDLSQMEGLRDQEEGSILIAKSVDKNKKKRKAGSDDKDKSKKRKKAETKKLKTGKSAKSGASNPVLVHGKVSKKNENLSARKVDKCCLESREYIRYTREQLLQLQQMAVVPDNILKTVQVIGADLLDKNQNSASGVSPDASCFNERQPGTPLEDMKADGKSLDASDFSRGQQGISTEVKQTEEKGSGILKKKKRGSSSEARKEKKKQKRRQKRAELNKKLGVKRLKLRPPVLKPKVVQHCRHYLKGRCQEGEKCKFSHDVVPLTKSKPCCHFARQACLKGDDCPFDHELSKYPCNNYVATGFCIRGDACLFSHKVQDKEGLEHAAGGSKDMKCPDQLDMLKPKQQHDANLLSSGVETLKETSGTKACQPAQAPKGLSFVSFGKSSLDNSVRSKEPDSSLQNQRTDHQLNQTQSGITVGPGNLLIHGTLTRGPSTCEMLKASASPATPKEISLPSLHEPTYDSYGAYSRAINKHSDSRTPITEKRSTIETDNLKATQPDPFGFPASSGQCSRRVGGPVESISNTAQRALSSTLAFAAKYESGIKMSSAAATKEVDNKNEGRSSSGGGTKKEVTKASAILDFLFSSGNKQKQ